jgi:Family of unknown function (DUF5682)
MVGVLHGLPRGVVTLDARPTVEVYGIRHHGPGSARSMLAALADFEPDAVLIEGPADADRVLDWVLADGMQPPLALLAYAPERPSVAAFWPFATFSPEWQAMTWARGRGIETHFCDLPAAMSLAAQPLAAQPAFADQDHRGPARDDGDHPQDVDPDEPAVVLRRDQRSEAADPLRALAEAAGYDDPERWWDDMVESRLDGSSPFPALVEAMTELRAELGPSDSKELLSEARREAYMRQTIRSALRRGRSRVAVVCGAWHAPAVQPPLPPAKQDAAILRGSRRRKITITWVPWSHERLAASTGYGAGVASPGWYAHLWSAPDQPIARWLSKVARSLRTRDLTASSAQVIEAVRLAETLAALRGRPLAGLSEVTEATRAVLCDGDERAVRFITQHLVVGQALGAVNEHVPTVPLEADLLSTCRRLRVRREAAARIYDLDLRKPYDQDRSRLFHRLRLLEIDWVRPARSDIEALGTFRETWRVQWRPEFSVAVVEASVWGTTVADAAGGRVGAVLTEGNLVQLTQTVERCLHADLPDALRDLLAALTAKAALDADVVHLMEALPALARAQRYGDVRRTDTTALKQVSDVLLRRICAGLPRAVTGLDEDNATQMRGRIDEVSGAVSLLRDTTAEGSTVLAMWHDTLAATIDRRDVHGQLVGRMVRLLHDAERLDDVAVRLQRALSVGADAAAKAAWVDGFFADGALLLIHDHELRRVLEAWVQGLGEPEFVDLLPLVRRSFATFSAAERRAIGDRVASAGDVAEDEQDANIDKELAAPALATVQMILRAGHA